ncbi:DUF885 domain-containing protein [Streptomyces yaanensis]|uniref:DUF885 domain-containing protein n=1 Tax=Streptomyces yaanensis TaxID=1142239 RepID=A0ABV7SL44_9ACTN|nr:DUF885 domain-containing protein [Streptomyces sp. CGMCC 4.7035]WNC00436.1 DUF885 domain-containing protein [Streptomyces sp. CGMCC 4.7035]
MTGGHDTNPAGIRAIADEFHHEWLTRHPFLAMDDGIPGYDHLVPDLSGAADRDFRSRLLDLADRARAAAAPPGPDSVTRQVVLSAIERELDFIAVGAVEYTVSAVGEQGPSALLTAGARTRLSSPGDAQAYLARCAEFPRYLREHATRLQAGAEQGRTPVASLVRVALDQVGRYLADRDGDVLADVPPPAGWSGARNWSDRIRALVADEVRPALAQWHDAVARLPARADTECGLYHLPGGLDAYGRLVKAHTTVDRAVADIHDLGLTEVAALTAQMTALGKELGLHGFPAVVQAFAASAAGVGAEEAMAQARVAIHRAEAALADLFSAPLPPPCEVAAMPVHLGQTGHAPHYTSPRLDGSAKGVFWFNAQHPETGSGWALEALAFHEAVPGHHLQLSRAQLLGDLPDLQRYGSVTAHCEGWALYAEKLAEEAGLYSSTEARLGALGLRLFRAARLVVDTGIHALGWSRAQATTWLTRTVPLPAAFAEAEIARYIAVPAQALSYTIGMHELLRLRDKADTGSGPARSLRDFHAAVLDHGSVPLPLLADIVEEGGHSTR